MMALEVSACPRVSYPD